MANATWSTSDKSVGITLSGSNLIATNNNNSLSGVRAADAQSLGKFYWEYTCTTFVGANCAIGIVASTITLSGQINGAAVGKCGIRGSNGGVYVDGVLSSTTFGAAITSGTVIGIALDCTARLVWFRLGAAGNWNNSAGANPATGSGGVLVTVGMGIPVYPWVLVSATNDSVAANFGDAAFTGTVPSGFTSGFTAGVSVPTNALVTQVVLEHWATVADAPPVVPSTDTRAMVLA